MSDASTAVATVDPKSLSKVDLAKALDFAKAIDPGNNGSLTMYGSAAQGKIATLADNMLNQIRTKDSGEVGTALTQLVGKIKDVDVGGLTKDHQSLFSKLAHRFENFISKYEKLETQIDKIVNELNKSRMTMMNDINMLDQLYKQNLEFMHNLDLFIAGGVARLDDLTKNMLPKMQQKAKDTGDPIDAQNLNDFQEFLHRVDKKLYDLRLSRMISIQTAPQVRLIQNSDQALVEKIQTSIMNTIPLWKNQIVIAITLFRQKKALGVQTAVREATNDLLTRNSEMLHQGSVEVAKENERGIVEIETLQKVNSDLISTIDDVIQIQEQGKQQRAAAEVTLIQLESDLKAKLVAARSGASN